MSKKKRFFLELSYHGKPFHGWQIQKNAFSVQESIEAALTTYFKKPIHILGSGRTDTGVHASHQVCHFDIDEDFDITRLRKGLNGILPKEIGIKTIRPVVPNAHSRFDAEERAYFYRIIFLKNPFLDDFAWTLFFHPDIEKMNKAAAYLIGEQDFEAFSKIHTEVNHFRCKIKEAYWEQKDGELLFHITADRFLRGMVRTIVGTLIDIGLGKCPPESMLEIIKSKDRSQAGKAAPAKGLFLCRVNYPKRIYLD